jgi:hypothetical protein
MLYTGSVTIIGKKNYFSSGRKTYTIKIGLKRASMLYIGSVAIFAKKKSTPDPARRRTHRKLISMRY